jgi:predicted transcriptional regulator
MTVADIETRLRVVEEEVAALREELEVERVRAGIRLGLEQAAQGKTVPAREFMEKMRKKYKLARR